MDGEPNERWALQVQQVPSKLTWGSSIHRRVWTRDHQRGRPDLAGDHRIDPLHHCPRAPTPCSAPIHEDPLTPLPPFSHPSHCKRTPPPTTEVISDPNPLAVTLTLTSPYTHTITSEPGPKDCLWPGERWSLNRHHSVWIPALDCGLCWD